LTYLDRVYIAYVTDPVNERTEERRFAVRATREPIHVHMTPAHRLGDRGPERFSVIVQYADGSPASCDVTMGWIPQSPGEGVTNRADSANDVTLLAEKTSRFGVVGVGGVVLPGPGALPFTARDAERREG
jgi:hypothetical protein